MKVYINGKLAGSLHPDLHIRVVGDEVRIPVVGSEGLPGPVWASDRHMVIIRKGRIDVIQD